MKYSKLIRDKIPEIILGDNQIPVTHVASDEEYKQRLLEKLSEEVDEFYLGESIEELADITEVIYAIAKSRGVSRRQFEEMGRQKKKERGGFEKKLILDEIK